MKYIDEYRDSEAVNQLRDSLSAITTKSWTLMEVCGGQTHAIVKFGLDELIPRSVELVHGPGCPVCVTPLELIDRALYIAEQPNVIFCTFGDMMRVPGSRGDLFSVKAKGADVRMVYSPLDALQVAEKNPDKEVVFFAVGFETTAPMAAMSVCQADTQGISNFSLLVSHVLVPPAIEAILSSPSNRVQGFLAAGHVCAVMGLSEYGPLAAKYNVPIVSTGFEPVDILHGIYLCVKQLEEGRAEVENQYTRAVPSAGNKRAQEAIQEVFTVVHRKWRGIGEISQSGLGLQDKYKSYNADRRFDTTHIVAEEPAECESGRVLQGLIKPHECGAFGTLCTPEHPLGATMVSSEGACAAYYRYRKRVV